METRPEPWLVLGATGFLGVHAVRAALAAGRAVVWSSSRSAPPPGLGLEGLPSVAADLGLAGEPARLVERVGPGVVLSCAALSRGGDCEQDPARAARLNAEVPGELAAACAAAGARLVHVSTDLVFDGEPPRAAGYREEDAARPLSVYGRTKLEGEEAVLAADPGALVARLPLLLGPSLGRGLGASDSLLAAAARGDTASLFVDELRTPLDVREAAAALVELAAGGASGRLHVAGPERVSRHALGVLVLRAAGLRAAERERVMRAVRRADFDLSPPRPRDVSLDATRARALLGAPLSSPWRALGLSGAGPG
jgi:dTDP-4-dehydrorhamnose reductase